MAALNYTWTIDEGDTFWFPLEYSISSTPVDLTGKQIRFVVRRRFGDDPSLNLSTQNGGILATPLTGQFTLYGTAAQMRFPFVKGVYDLELYTTAATPYKKTLLSGVFKVNRDGGTA